MNKIIINYYVYCFNIIVFSIIISNLIIFYLYFLSSSTLESAQERAYRKKIFKNLRNIYIYTYIIIITFLCKEQQLQSLLYIILGMSIFVI